MQKIAVFVLVFVGVVFSITAQHSSNELRYVGSLHMNSREALIGDGFQYMQLFFDKWNNLYFPNGDSPKISVYKSNFQPYYEFAIGENECFLDGRRSLANLMGYVAYQADDVATLFYFRDGKLVDVIKRGGYAGWIAIDDFTLIYDNEIKKPRSWVLVDRASRTIKELDPEQTIEYVKQNGPRYDLSLQGNAILFHGWTWEEYGSSIVWKDKIHGGWQAIDKDKIAYDGECGKTLDGRTVLMYDFIGYPKNEKKLITGSTFDYEGNYFKFCENDIYYLGRDWGYENIFEGKVNDSNANLRLHAGLDELKLSILEKNEAVTVLEKTLQMESIGGQTSSWYKVKRKDGLVGWMFGAYLTLLNGEDGIQTYESPALSLRGLK
jgi:hypothetical protein